jgi:hypothetical protein
MPGCRPPGGGSPLADTPDRVDYPRMTRVVHEGAGVIRELAGESSRLTR